MSSRKGLVVNANILMRGVLGFELDKSLKETKMPAFCSVFRSWRPLGGFRNRVAKKSRRLV